MRRAVNIMCYLLPTVICVGTIPDLSEDVSLPVDLGVLMTVYSKYDTKYQSSVIIAPTG